MKLDDDVIVEYEAWLSRFAFTRTETRRAKFKRTLDCGHIIDGSELYRYVVSRRNYDERGVIGQRTDCEPCARRDNRF